MIKETADFYRCVLDDVVARMKPEFVQEGVDESVLLELRSLWEQKLLQGGLLVDPDQEADEPSSSQAGVKGEGVKLEEAGPSQEPDTSAGKRRAKSGPSTSKSRRTSNTTAAERRIPQGDAPGDGDDAEGEQEPEPEDPAGEDDLEADKLEDVQVDEDEEDDECDNNFLIAQFEKVSRAKNRWKVIMKDGVFYVNGKDHVFKKLTGEFVF